MSGHPWYVCNPSAIEVSNSFCNLWTTRQAVHCQNRQFGPGIIYAGIGSFDRRRALGQFEASFLLLWTRQTDQSRIVRPSLMGLPHLEPRRHGRYPQLNLRAIRYVSSVHLRETAVSISPLQPGSQLPIVIRPAGALGSSPFAPERWNQRGVRKFGG